MEMDSLPSEDHPETAEPGPSSERPSSERPSYKDAQVWKDIEAETGFASYADCLRFYRDVRPDFGDRLEESQKMPEELRIEENDLNARYMPSIVIYDLSKKENLPTSLSLRGYYRSGTELIQALREPPDDVCVQLVLWSFWENSLNQETTDALVLGLNLDIQFLDQLGTLPHRVRRSRENRLVFHTSELRSVVGNGTVATISQTSMSEVANVVPVLPVAIDSTPLNREQTPETILAEDDYRGPRIRGHLYARTVEQFIVQGQSPTPSKAFLFLAAVSPLLYIEGYRVQERFNKLQVTYGQLTQNGYKRLEKILDRERLKLRRNLEEAEDRVSQIFRYLGSKVDVDWSKEPSYVSFRADWKNLVDGARRLESEVRDYMQLQVGNLSLEESRRSIELSNLQIRESKSVKIFTILAFIYVPLNLATSIFGMNIQQLNGSGQNLWAFFTTAVIALFVTGGSWLCSNLLASHKALAWYKERAAAKRTSDKETKNRGYGLLLRIAMLVWLVRSGYTIWMWMSGACIAILMNSNVHGYTTSGEHIDTACDYVSDRSQPDQIEWLESYFEGPRAVTWSPLSEFLSRFSRSRDSERGFSEVPARWLSGADISTKFTMLNSRIRDQ